MKQQVKWVVLLAALIGMGASVLSGQTYTVTGTQLVGYSSAPWYIQDAHRQAEAAGGSDPFENFLYSGWYMPVQATGSLSGGTTGSHRMAFSLVDQTTGDLVQLENVSNGSTVTVIYSASATLASGGSTVYPANLVVASGVQLDPHRSYRVRAQLQRWQSVPIGDFFIFTWVAVGTPQDSGNLSFVHFKGPWGSDAARNVVTRTNSVTHLKRHALRNVAGQDTFRARVAVTLYRFDDPHTINTPPPADDISLRITLQLYENVVGSPPIPLETSVFTRTVSVPRKAYIFLLNTPAEVAANLDLDYKPTVQLDTVNRVYRLEATVEHLETPLSDWRLSRTVNPGLWSLAHFTGKLSFGSIQTTLTGIGSVGLPGSLVAGVQRNVSVSGAEGVLDGGSHGYGPTGSISIGINAAGDAFIRSPSTVTLNPPESPDVGTVAGVRFNRGAITLSASGAAAAGLDVLLPAGAGMAFDATSKQLHPWVSFAGSIALNQALRPILNQTASYFPSRWLVEETKPVAMAVSQINWEVSSGRFYFPGSNAPALYVREQQMQRLDSLPVPANQRIRRSNELYYRAVQSHSGDLEINVGFNNAAEFSGKLNLQSAVGVKVQGHFPYDVTYVVSDGHMNVIDDRIVTATSYLNLADPVVKLDWSAGCSEPACDDGSGSTQTVLFEVPYNGPSPQLSLSADGGVFVDGSISGGLDLRWGHIPALGDYAHAVATPFFDGKLAIAGHFINGAEIIAGGFGQLFGAASILLSGINDDGSITERPELVFDTTTPYAIGRASYAGLNLILGADDATPSGVDGLSRLGGEIYGPYELKSRSKYYVRKSGVTGIHDKVPSAPDTVTIYGYPITLTNFGLAFLSNDNVDSRTSGSVYLAYPSNIKPEFDRLTFLCNGALDKMDVAAGSSEHLLNYWLAPIDILAMQFASGNDCDVGEAYLTMAVNGYASHVKETLNGTLGFFSHGNLIPKYTADSIGGGMAGLDSRLKLPNRTTFRGPLRQTTQGGNEEYILTPVADAYFNNPGLPADNFAVDPVQHPAGDGFVNMAGRLKVAFFEAMPTHIQTTSNRPPGDGGTPGNWGNAILHVAKGGWNVGGVGRDYFGTDYHDPWNRGFPYPVSAGGSGDTLEFYRSNPQYYPSVRQTWLGGAIVLKYKVEWNSTTRTFKSLDAADSVDSEDGYSASETKKFVILEIDHRLKYLSAERAELTFGASYDGLPSINLTNFVVNQLDEATGVFKAATDAGLDLVFDTINGAIDDLAMMLSDNLRAYLESILEEPVDLLVDEVYVFLQTNWNNVATGWQNAGIPPDLESILGDLIQEKVFDPLNPAVSTVQDQAAQLVAILTEVEDALIVLRDDFLATNPSTQQLVAIQTLSRELIKVISAEVGGTLGSLLDAAGVDQRLNDLLDPHLEFVKPTVAQIHGIVSELADVIGQIRGTLDGVVNFDFRDHLAALFVTADTEITNMKSDALDALMEFLGDYGPVAEQGVNFLARDPDDVKALIKNTIYDFVLDTVLIEQIQVAIKQRLKDVEVAIRQGIDNAFAEVNGLIKEAISEFLSEVDDQINGVLGSVSDKMGSGSLIGYAIFNGDALRKVRIDGKFEFKIPDETTIKAFLEINQYTSIDQPPGCVVLGPGEAYTEVTIGALDVGVNFIAPDLRVNVAAKFAMKSGSGAWSLRPDGFGGSFAIASGEVSFEAFTITELKLGIMFSSTEAYVSAALGMKIGDYGAKGGIFLGRTCTLEPIELWDPLVASALGEPSPSFTGIYVYGEAHIPVSEVLLGIPASCFFKITADAGVGFFYFVEGPTFGARIGLGVTGELLCLVTVSGRIDMVGARVGSVTRLKGKGRAKGKIGPCSFCIKFDKSIAMETEIGSDGKMSGKGGTK